MVIYAVRFTVLVPIKIKDRIWYVKDNISIRKLTIHNLSHGSKVISQWNLRRAIALLASREGHASCR